MFVLWGAIMTMLSFDENLSLHTIHALNQEYERWDNTTILTLLLDVVLKRLRQRRGPFFLRLKLCDRRVVLRLCKRYSTAGGVSLVSSIYHDK
jgi:hypothetical protein